MRNKYRAIARVAKTHGKHGEVVTVPVDGLPLLVREGLEVAVVPPRLKGSRFRTVRRCGTSRAGQLVSLSGVSDLDAASHLVGRTLLARVEDLPADFDRHDAGRLIGREVVDDAFGPLGEIDEVMVGAGNDVWVVEGPYGEVMVPVVDEMVGEVGPAGPIRVHIPAGLVDGGDSADADDGAGGGGTHEA